MSGSKFYLILQAAVCVLLAALLCASAVAVCRDGLQRQAGDPRAAIYTPGIVREKLAAIAPLAFVGIGLLIAGKALGVRSAYIGRNGVDPETARDAAAARIARPSEEMRRERTAQLGWRAAGWIGFAACMIPIAVWLLNPAHFPADDPEGMFAELLWTLIPWTVAGIGALTAASAMRTVHARRELEAAREQLRREGAGGIVTDPRSTADGKRLGALRAALLAVAAALILLGVFNQSARDVLYKAITICTECVGLG